MGRTADVDPMGSMTAIGNSTAPGVAELRVSGTSASGTSTRDRDELDVVDDWAETPMPWVTVPCLPAKTFLTDMYNTSTGLLDLYL
jgi:hypothetical protein